jgi:mRNA interferase RelE/StbE
MAYTVQYQSDAIADLKKLDKVTQKRIINKISWLVENFEQIRPQSLSENWADFYKLRVGDCRVIYTFDIAAQVISIVKIGHRREIYET